MEDNPSNITLSTVKKGKNRKIAVRSAILLAIALPLAVLSYLFFFKVSDNPGYLYRDSLTPEAMKTDAHYFVETLKSNHPNMNEGQSAYDGIIDDIYEKIKKPMDSEDFYWTLDTLAVALKDGHTRLFIDEISRDNIDLPMLIWTSDGLIVKKSGAFLMKGDKIVSIGGMAPDGMQKELEALYPAEIPEWVRANINVISEGIYLRRLNLVDRNNAVTIRYERNGRVSAGKMQLHGSGASLYKRISDAFAYADSVRMKWRIDKEHGLGIIEINECKPGKQTMEGFREFFTAVDKDGIKNIAVDLRRNSGGNDRVASQFLSFVAVKSYLFIGNELRYNNPGEYRELKPEDPPLFGGNIYLLTSNSTFSAATDFTVVLQANSIAKVIGQPTGNTASFFGNPLHFNMPDCKLGFSCATGHYEAPVAESNQDKAVMPDYKVECTRQDIIDGRDPSMDFLTDLIGRQAERTN